MLRTKGRRFFLVVVLSRAWCLMRRPCLPFCSSCRVEFLGWWWSVMTLSWTSNGNGICSYLSASICALCSCGLLHCSAFMNLFLTLAKSERVDGSDLMWSLQLATFPCLSCWVSWMGGDDLSWIISSKMTCLVTGIYSYCLFLWVFFPAALMDCKVVCLSLVKSELVYTWLNLNFFNTWLNLNWFILGRIWTCW